MNHVSVNTHSTTRTASKPARQEVPSAHLLLDEFDAEPVPGLLNRRLKCRVLLWDGASTIWPRQWMDLPTSATTASPDGLSHHDPRSTATHGVQLAFEGIDPLHVGSGRLDALEDCQLWIPASRLKAAAAQAPTLIERVLQTGGQLVTISSDADHPALWRLQALQSLTGPAVPGKDPVATLPQLLQAEVLQSLPNAQRFQGKVALAIEAASHCHAQWSSSSAHPAKTPLIAGSAIHDRLACMIGPRLAGTVLGALVGAVRSRNSLDSRLRNMPNERLALLLLVAVARLGERARAFTVREISRELGAVATGT